MNAKGGMGGGGKECYIRVLGEEEIVESEIVLRV